MILGIDASNIKAGGGITHLKNLLENGNPNEFEISRVVVWGGQSLNNLPNKPWLEKRLVEDFDRSFIYSVFAKIFKLGRDVDLHCDLLFCPGGIRPLCRTPVVSMSQNMLVFENAERARFPLSWTRIRYHILEILQYLTLRSSRANIFISNYAKDYIFKKYSKVSDKPSMVIYHGVGIDFRSPVSAAVPMSNYSFEKPFKLLYVSIINFYKHQDKVISAVIKLRNEGLPVELNLVGPYYYPAWKKIRKQLSDERISSYIKYHGKVDYENINLFYKDSHGFIFASTCENMPNILIEAMSSGLPILCSEYGPMPEVLQSAGIYFDPLCVDSIANNLREFLLDYESRFLMAEKSKRLSEKYSWKMCSDQTFAFLASIKQ